ncbi:MAG: TnsA endonuclease N-terminal domain-containing protein [Acidobacteriaceae bacterium]
MAKRRYEVDETKIRRFVKEGRGKGSGADYKPWLRIQDVPSLGRVSRVHGFKTEREHHLLSDLETGLFFLLEWSDVVTDIREQFPLDREVTRMLAEQMGIAHPRDSRTQTDLVMTTDFLVNVRTEGQSVTLARAVKPANELAKKRTIEKLELERRYWARESVPWHIVTDRDLPRQRITNIRWLHELHSLDHLVSPHPGYWPDRCERFVEKLRHERHGSIGDFFARLESTEGFAIGEPLTTLRHVAAHHIVTFDLDQPFSAKAPIGFLQVAKAADLNVRRSA